MIVSVTRLHIRSVRHLPIFAWLTLRSHIHIREAKGLVQSSYHKEGLFTYWTMSIWETEEDMKAFRNQGAHLEAMRCSRQLADELQYVRFEVETPDIQWEACKQRLHQSYARQDKRGGLS
ncbi:hypothetical protein ABC345_02625 [Shouchella sp. 1P09AA]|uniref:hypothetical protein n=1 Tax=unclassified Shouchella TaxID=2893065 RepID=UPI0039A240AF